MTLTLELPDDIAERLTALPETERISLTVSLLKEWADQSLSEEDIAAVEEGIDDLAVGRHRPLNDFIAERVTFWKERGIVLAAE